MLVALLLVLAATIVLTAEPAQTLHGRVVGISDGDTLTLLTPERRQVKIRLAEIDTPERRQPYGSRARQALAELVFGEAVRVEVQTVDRYGRSVGRVYRGSDGLDVNAALVRSGSAWVYRRYSEDPALLALERQARAAEAGLWALPQAQRAPPWEWRAQQRRGTGPSGRATREPAAGAFSCGAKRYCGQMHSCAEARFHLQQCGLERLDGDGDGTPCESLCRDSGG